MKLKRVAAWGLAFVMTLSLDIPGVNAASGAIDTTLTTTSKDEQMDMVQNQKKLPGTDRTFFDSDSDIRDWFNVSGFAADGVQDRSEYYDEYVANGYKNTDNYVVVEEDGYWEKTTKAYITTTEYEALDEAAKANYRFVTAEEQFTTAFDTKPKVIQVNATELELGYHYLEDNNIPSGRISAVSDYEKGNAPITNPIIMHKNDNNGVDDTITGTGVSDLSLYSHLTIFSTTGCILRHVGLDLSEQEDVIIRNFQFAGMYEWDDQTENICGGSDFTTRKRYGYCYVSGNHSNNIWVDHCTFGYAFDGNIDLKNGSSFSITWCQFGVQDISDNGETPVSITMDGNTPVYSGTRWSESQGSELWKNILYMEEIYQGYKAGIVEEGNQYHLYTKYRDEGATPQELLRYGAMHSKVHLVGSGESSFYTNVDEKISLGFNYYESIIQRVPMIRQGNGHMYNCIVDDTDFIANAQALRNKGVSVGYTSGGCINARDGASIGADTCIFRAVRPINSGSEYQDGSNVNATQWQNIMSYLRNNQLIVNSSVQDYGDADAYVGSSWDNNGSNKFMPSFTWKDHSSIGDFHWAKWANQDAFAVYQPSLGRLDGDEQKLWAWAEKDWSAYAREYYIGSDDLGYSYQCFDLDEVESKVMTYGGAQNKLYGENETVLDYIQPYSQKSVEAEYGKKVTINTDGGTVADKSNNVYYIKNRESITLPTSAEMTKEGYDFVGWKKGSYVDGQLQLGELLAEPDAAVTVTAPDTGYEEENYYAIWKIKTYKITFDSMGGSEVSTVLEAENNQTIKAAGGFPADPTKEGATFLGWYKYTPETQEYGSKVLATAKVTSDMMLYAKWKNTITFNTDGGTEIADKKVDSGNKVSVADPVKEGFTFVGWFTDEDFTTEFDVKNDKVMEPMTLYAKFVADAPATVTVSFETGFQDVTVGAIQVEVGATGSAILAVETPVATDDSIEFQGWYMDEECTEAFDPEAVITEDMTLYAKWGSKSLLGDVNGDGLITAEDALGILKKVVGAEQEVFNESSADCNGDGSTTAEDALAVLKKVVGAITDFSELQQ